MCHFLAAVALHSLRFFLASLIRGLQHPVAADHLTSIALIGLGLRKDNFNPAFYTGFKSGG